MNTFEESAIADESLYGYHRKCYQDYTHKQKLQSLVANKRVGIEQRKSGRESRTKSTCNKLINSHSLLREICVGELLAPNSFILFKAVYLTKLRSN